MFRVEASVYVPVAVNCRDVPAAIEGLAGVIAIEVRIGGVMFTPTEEFRSGVGFHSIAPRVPKTITSFLGRPSRKVLQDRAGEWWLASDQGLIRYILSAVQISRQLGANQRNVGRHISSYLKICRRKNLCYYAT